MNTYIFLHSMEQIGELRQLLPKYTFMPYVSYIDNVNIIYPKYDFWNTISIKILFRDIKLIKFIHDNLDYFIEMLILNGFVKYGDRCHFRRDHIFVKLYVDTIIVQYFIEEGDGDDTPCVLKNSETMFDDLRKFIDIDISHKIVLNKNE